MIAIDVKIKGLVGHDIDKAVQRAILEESMQKFAPRLRRGGRGIGAKRNPVETIELGPLDLIAESSANFPRTTGKAWAGKNEAILKSMAPRVIRKTFKRMTDDLAR